MDRKNVIVGGAAAAFLFALRPAGALGSSEPASASHVEGLAGFKAGDVRTQRHHTSYIETGPRSGPLMIFVHGFPELGIIWTAQMTYFAQRGWRCVAPDMRGYGGSSAPTEVDAYTVREISADMAELHDALGSEPAIWVGHDWGSPIVWAMASNHPERCRGVISLSVPYLSMGHALPNLVALVDREMYPVDRYPVGQWDYWLYFRETFALAQRDFESNTPGTIAAIYQPGMPQDVETPSLSASVRDRGGWFGATHTAPLVAHDPQIMSQSDFQIFVAAFRKSGFRSAIAWYLNDVSNIDFAGSAKDFGRLSLPVLFINGGYDGVDGTSKNRLAEPMRVDCSNLTEAQVLSGHFLMLEKKTEVSNIISDWLAAKVVHV